MLATPMVVTPMVIWFSCGLRTYIGARRHIVELSRLAELLGDLLSDWPIPPF